MIRMRPLNVLIIEDEPLAAERLSMLLRDYDPSVRTLAILDSIESSREWLQTHPEPDLIFLDIELADGNSLRLLEDVRPGAPIIFTTAYERFALDAFRWMSMDYLLKPVTKMDLARAMKKFTLWADHPKLEKPQPDTGTRYKKRFLVRTGNRMQFVESTSIAYLMAEEKNVFLVTLDGQRFPLELSLDKLQSLLDPSEFFRLNRKVIANVSSIRDIRAFMNSRLRISLHAGPRDDEAIVSRDRVHAFRMWAEA
jgi:DNA-binding LytR/AlgR family response regulator